MSLQEQIQQAFQDKTPLHITGSGSKDFLGEKCSAEPLSTLNQQGIISYQPEELVIRARAGTPLWEIEAALAEKNQILPFEPPHYGKGATLGGTLACGLSGPARPWRGSARDFVLGTRLINGKGEQLHFGGEVIKNVAGYDVSRLMTGAFGTLGLILEASIKTIPRPATELTLCWERDKQAALDLFPAWSRLPLPVSAAAWHDNRMYLRLSGSPAAVETARKELGGESLADSVSFWTELREQRLAFFESAMPLWRVSLPRASGVLKLPGTELLDWGGAQRWLLSEAEPTRIQELARDGGGYASPFRHAGPLDAEAALPGAVLALHRRLKTAFDPAGILNPGRMYGNL